MRVAVFNASVIFTAGGGTLCGTGAGTDEEVEDSDAAAAAAAAENIISKWFTSTISTA